MAELRWVLLALGILLVAGVYLWGRGILRRSELARIKVRRRAEPHISTPSAFSSGDFVEERASQPGSTAELERGPESEGEGEGERSKVEPSSPEPLAPPEKIVTIRFIANDPELSGEETVLALRAAGLTHGRYGIFHMHDEAFAGEEQFSVASLTEPGSFDLENLASKPIPGMSFFMVLPGTGDPVARFDAMVETARDLARKLDAELFDDRGSSWSIQRERYVREEIIRYRHEFVQP